MLVPPICFHICSVPRKSLTNKVDVCAPHTVILYCCLFFPFLRPIANSCKAATVGLKFNLDVECMKLNIRRYLRVQEGQTTQVANVSAGRITSPRKKRALLSQVRKLFGRAPRGSDRLRLRPVGPRRHLCRVPPGWGIRHGPVRTRYHRLLSAPPFRAIVRYILHRQCRSLFGSRLCSQNLKFGANRGGPV